MPNWTFNNVRAKKEILAPYINEEGNFDFNLIIPMPKELDITSGSITDESITYYLTGGLKKKPNELDASTKELLHKLVNNNFNPDWPMELYEKLSKREVNAQEYLDMGKRYVDNYKKYGAVTWYEWCNANWGTKWNASDCDIYEEDGELNISFNTAWSEPEGIIDYFVVEVSPKYPDDRIEWSYSYEDSDDEYCTIIKNGDSETEVTEADEDFDDYEELDDDYFDDAEEITDDEL